MHARDGPVGHCVVVHACRQKGRPASGEETTKANSRSPGPAGTATSRRRQPVPSRAVRGTASVPRSAPSANACTTISGAIRVVGALADDAGAQVQDLARPAAGSEAAADGNLHAAPRHVVHLVLFDRVGEVGRELRRVQVPGPQGERPEALLVAFRRCAAGPQRRRRVVEERRARQRQHPQPPHRRIVESREILLGQHRRRVDEEARALRPGRARSARHRPASPLARRAPAASAQSLIGGQAQREREIEGERRGAQRDERGERDSTCCQA